MGRWHGGGRRLNTWRAHVEARCGARLRSPAAGRCPEARLHRLTLRCRSEARRAADGASSARGRCVRARGAVGAPETDLAARRTTVVLVGSLPTRPADRLPWERVERAWATLGWRYCAHRASGAWRTDNALRGTRHQCERRVCVRAVRARDGDGRALGAVPALLTRNRRHSRSRRTNCARRSGGFSENRQRARACGARMARVWRACGARVACVWCACGMRVVWRVGGACGVRVAGPHGARGAWLELATHDSQQDINRRKVSSSDVR